MLFCPLLNALAPENPAASKSQRGEGGGWKVGAYQPARVATEGLSSDGTRLPDVVDFARTNKTVIKPDIDFNESGWRAHRVDFTDSLALRVATMQHLPDGKKLDAKRHGELVGFCNTVRYRFHVVGVSGWFGSLDDDTICERKTCCKTIRKRISVDICNCAA